MSRFDVDLFVVGGGSGGVRAARVAAEHGARVAIAEAEEARARDLAGLADLESRLTSAQDSSDQEPASYSATSTCR